MPTALIIAGDRHMTDYHLLEKEVNKFRKKYNFLKTIVSGRAKGADRLGEVYAKRYGLKLVTFPAHWETYGKAAGPIRNQQMADYATHCIAFLAPHSVGTRSMINIAKKNKLVLKIVNL